MANQNKDVLAAMTYETRGPEQGFANAENRYLLVAYDGDKAIGYVYCDASVIPESAKHFRPMPASIRWTRNARFSVHT